MSEFALVAEAVQLAHRQREVAPGTLCLLHDLAIESEGRMYCGDVAEMCECTLLVRCAEVFSLLT